MSDQGDNIVELAARFIEAPPVDLLQERWDACKHEHVWLDERLHLVGCSDCGEERLDAFQVLVTLARKWRTWKREAEELRRLNAEYHVNRRATWERARDRHLTAHPDHEARHFMTQGDGTIVPREYVRAMEYNLRRKPGSYGMGITMPPRDECRSCYRLIMDFDSRWIVRSAPEPPPGKLQPDMLALSAHQDNE